MKIVITERSIFHPYFLVRPPNDDDFINITSFSSNHQEDQVPAGSILVNVTVTKLRNNMFRYLRTWKLSTSVKINGINYLEGDGWINKLEMLLEYCQISNLVVTSLKTRILTNDPSAKIEFYNRTVKLHCASKIDDYLKANYPDKVFII